MTNPSNVFLTCETGLIFNLCFSIFYLGFNDSRSIAEWRVTQGAAEGHSGDAQRVFPGSVVMWPMTHDLLEHFSEARGHQVVEDWVDCRAEVEKDSGDDVHVLKDFKLAVGPVADEAPHQTVGVERRPADCENHH